MSVHYTRATFDSPEELTAIGEATLDRIERGIYRASRRATFVLSTDFEAPYLQELTAALETVSDRATYRVEDGEPRIEWQDCRRPDTDSRERLEWIFERVMVNGPSKIQDYFEEVCDRALEEEEQ